MEAKKLMLTVETLKFVVQKAEMGVEREERKIKH